jgi:mutator protein MutT
MNLNNKQALSQKSPLGDLGVSPSFHYRFCPRCSAEGTFNSQNNSFKCSTCGFNFFLNSAAAVTALIFNQEKELLMTRRGIEPAIGKLDLPGGFVDPGESAENALFREIGEELDLVPDEISYYGSFPNQYQFSGTIVDTIDLVFKCRVTDFSKLKYRDDICGIEFVKLEEIDLDEVPFQSVKNIIRKLLDGGSY